MSVIEKSEFAQLVRETRKHLGLKQEEFALKLGVSLPTISRWENGQTQPLLLAVMRVEEMLREMGESGQNNSKFKIQNY